MHERVRKWKNADDLLRLIHLLLYSTKIYKLMLIAVSIHSEKVGNIPGCMGTSSEHIKDVPDSLITLFDT